MSAISDLLNSRRSIRKFSDKLVDDSLIENLLSVSARTSTCGNMQLYSAVVTRDSDLKSKLAPAHFCQPAFTNAPVIVTFCADYNRFSKWCQQSGAVPGYDNMESFLSAAVDTIALAQTFSLLAEEAGLGICYLGTTTYNPSQIAQVLNLPKLVFPVVTLSVGYPDEQPALTDRIDCKGWIHRETYKDYTEADIKSIFDYKEDIEENKAFVKENGMSSLAQVFTDIRYTKKNNEAFSQQLMDFLKEQDYLK